MPKYTVAGLQKMEDSELMGLLGLTAKLDDFKSTLDEASKLEAADLKGFEEDLNRTLNPDVYVGGLKYDLQRAKKGKSGAGGDPHETCCC